MPRGGYRPGAGRPKTKVQPQSTSLQVESTSYGVTYPADTIGQRSDGTIVDKGQVVGKGALNRLRRAAGDILANVPEAEYWEDLIEAKVDVLVGSGESRRVMTIVDKRLRMEALKWLGDKRDGKAPQAVVSISGDSGGVQFTVRILGQSGNNSPAEASGNS